MATGALAERCSCKYPVNRIQHIIRNVFISGYCSVWPRNYRQVNLNPFFYIFFVSVWFSCEIIKLRKPGVSIQHIWAPHCMSLPYSKFIFHHFLNTGACVSRESKDCAHPCCQIRFLYANGQPSCFKAGFKKTDVSSVTTTPWKFLLICRSPIQPFRNLIKICVMRVILLQIGGL